MVTVTGVVPTGKVLPEAGLATTLWTAQLSAPAGSVKLTTAEHLPGSFACRMSVGQVMVGAWVSLTVTLKLQVAVLPEASVTLKLLTVVPTGKRDPLARPPVWVTT